ncbi:hypothetical protein EFA69_05285 [Rufibacter immobilis]|uniref:DUF4168 domain-containing protein n=1 Tax=Rufibacter immobilis TaxID=1348778 RepID=A0A3M9N3F2_9BACT|nr:hypothetical protein [Rufibacter immobilis]RNI31925.1 hypothetical protein EFA69_05285 [Rufibacter immobilis]
MKNFTLSLCLFAAVAFNASAQNAPKNDAVEKTSTSISRLMLSSMGMNENEYIQVRALNIERLSKAAEVAKTYENDAEMKEARLREIDEEFENKLFRILTSRQVEAYAEFKTRPEANFLSLVQEVTPGTRKK